MSHVLHRWSSLALTLLGACVFGTGCGSDEYRGSAKLVAHHFDRIASEDYSGAINEYAPTFFKQTSREEWAAKLRNMKQNLGELQSYTVGRATIRSETNGERPGTYVALVCQTRYKRFKAQEELTYYKQHVDDDFQILKHRVTSVKEMFD